MNSNFEIAAARFFHLPEHATVEVNNDGAGLAVFARIALSDDDMAGVVTLMQTMAATAPPAAPTQAFVDLPTVQQVMAAPWPYVPRPDCAEIVARAAQGSRVVREAVAQYELEHQMLADAARGVVHGPDADEDDEPYQIPPHVYLPPAQCTDYQRDCPMGVDTTTGYLAVALADLTEDQREAERVKLLDDIAGGKPLGRRVLGEYVQAGIASEDEMRMAFALQDEARAGRMHRDASGKWVDGPAPAAGGAA